jgi:hypothetical protein
MIHVELPPYRGLYSPLDLVVVEIVFGSMFEAFRRASQARHTGAVLVPTNDDKPLHKRQCQVSLAKKMSAPK